MKSFLLLAAIISGQLALADQLKPAVMDITCINVDNEDVLRVTSESNGAKLYKNGKVIYQQEQLTGGTEGGDPYTQIVGGGYNVIISGGDYQTAFDQSTRIVGVASAKVMDFENKNAESVHYICEGVFSF